MADDSVVQYCSLIEVMNTYNLGNNPSDLLTRLYDSSSMTDNKHAALLIALAARHINPELVLDEVIDEVMRRRVGHAGVASPLR